MSAPLRVLALALAASLGTIHQGHAAGSNAYAVDDVDVAAPGVCKVETWGSFADNRDAIGVIAPACVVSLLTPVELTAQVSRFRSEGEMGAVFNPKGKINLLPAEVGKIGIGLIGGGFLDLQSGRENGAFVTIPVTFVLTNSFKINVNGGWLYERVDDRHSFFYGAGFDWNFIKRLTLISEVFGFTNSDKKEPRAQIGLRYHIEEAVDLDLIYGRNITGENANWITVGLNMRFNALSTR